MSPSFSHVYILMRLLLMYCVDFITMYNVTDIWKYHVCIEHGFYRIRSYYMNSFNSVYLL